jgi:hypothetical protein
MAEQLRPELAPLPSRMQALKVHRGYPVPWFVSWVGGEPEFRVADYDKWVRAVKEKRCWVCGEALGRIMTFVIGPMCGINRVTSEPPCHIECARWSACNCPFLSRPNMLRREGNMPEGGAIPGEAIMRNPGATLLWTTRSYHLFEDGTGGVLFRIGEPEGFEWYAEGKPATRAAVLESVETGLPILQALAEDVGGIAELQKAMDRFMHMVPPEPSKGEGGPKESVPSLAAVVRYRPRCLRAARIGSR